MHYNASVLEAFNSVEHIKPRIMCSLNQAVCWKPPSPLPFRYDLLGKLYSSGYLHGCYYDISRLIYIEIKGQSAGNQLYQSPAQARG